MEIKDQIRIAREAAGLTQIQLANKLGISRQSIVWWEEGTHRPKSARIRALEEALNVRLDLSERGNATPLDKEVASLSVDPEVLRLAVAISRLPLVHRKAIETLIYIGERVALKKTSDEFNFIESAPKTRREGFMEIEKQLPDADEHSVTGGKLKAS